MQRKRPQQEGTDGRGRETQIEGERPGNRPMDLKGETNRVRKTETFRDRELEIDIQGLRDGGRQRPPERGKNGERQRKHKKQRYVLIIHCHITNNPKT